MQLEKPRLIIERFWRRLKMSVKYYKKVKELQRLQHENEQERMELDQQLNSYLKSGKNLTRFKAEKLKTYWQKICDDERKSRARNEQLLKEFQRVQTHMDALSARTERLRMLKEQYELQVERMYPRWKERIELKQQQRQMMDKQVEENEYQHLNRLLLQNLLRDSENQQGKPTIPVHVPQETNIFKTSTNHVPPMEPPISPLPRTGKQTQQANSYSCDYMEPQELSKVILSSKIPEQESKDDEYDYPEIVVNNYEVPQKPIVHDAPVKSSGVARETTDFSSKCDKKGTLFSVVPVKNNHGSLEEHRKGLSTDSESEYHPLDIGHSREQISDAKRSNSLESRKSEISRQHSAPTLSRQRPVDNDIQENASEQKEIPVIVESNSTPFTSDTENDETDKVTQDNLQGVTQNKADDVKQESTPLKEISDPEVESDSEIGSETSLPLSDDDSKTLSTQVKPNLSNETQPSVTTDGLWHMIRVIEQEIDESDEVDMIYNAPTGTPAIVSEIIKEANSKKSLQHLNPNTVSMVILQELPLLIRKSSGGCLISDKILTSTIPCTEVRIRSYMYSASLALWDRLLQHFVTLLERDVFTVEEIASKFAPLMIKEESLLTYKHKAINILKDVLAVVPLNETLDETVSSIGGATPKYTDNRTSTRLDEKNSQVPPLNLQGMKSDSEESYDSETSDHNVPLNETDAYQQMMRQLSHPGDMSEEDASGLEGDGDTDDVTPGKAAHHSPRLGTPPSCTRSSKGKRNVLSSLGGMSGLGMSYDEEEEALTARSQINTARSGQSDAISSLEPTPRESAYIPSAMDQSLKSTGRSDKRSAAFWGNESDIESESEMTVPMGTGTLGAGTGTMKSDEEDDFDFYD